MILSGLRRDATRHLNETAIRVLPENESTSQVSEVDTQAVLEVHWPDDVACLRVESQRTFGFLREGKQADGAFLVVGTEVIGIVVELKSRLTEDELGRALQQCRWSTIRLSALAGALGARMQRTIWCIGFREDAVLGTNPDPLALKLRVGDSADPDLEFPAAAWLARTYRDPYLREFGDVALHSVPMPAGSAAVWQVPALPK